MNDFSIRIFSTFMVLFISTLFTRADVVGYWKFDDGDPGTVASSIESSVHSSELIGAASGHAGGGAPQQSSDVPGKVIRAGKGGPVVNPNNLSSLAFTGGAKNSGGIVSIKTEVGKEVLLEPKSFTIEGFVKTGANQPFGIWFGKTLGGGTLTWCLGPDWTQGKVKIRADKMTSEFIQFHTSGLNSMAAKNGSSRWHHVALTYNDLTKTFSYFEDYIKIGALTFPAETDLQYDNQGELIIGDGDSPDQGNAYTGLIDEVRFSDSVLSPDDFLRAEQ
jgi:hypothetical protein